MRPESAAAAAASRAVVPRVPTPGCLEPSVSGAPVLAYIGLGANLGDAAAALKVALRSLSELPGTGLQQASSVYRTEPIDSQGPDYLNAVALLQTVLPPEELLQHLQRIESALGRERPYRNAPRTLDLDLLLYGEACLTSPTLTVPHPRMHERAFVLVPLADVAPVGLMIPGRGGLHDLLAGVAGQRIHKLEAS
jgi:2-amino-4-hydroxy-6-hydroxymethyldihydropteridine diphosphokinase